MTKSTFAKFRKYSEYHIKNYAVDAGLVAGNADFQKFIILGVSRSGSNLLRDLLNAHSQTITFGELFRNDDSLAWDCPVNDKFKSQSKKVVSLIQNDPIKLMENLVYGETAGHIKALGFKLFYYHAQGENLKPIWNYLRDNKDVKILHLKRTNYLKRYVSLVKAKDTNVWRDATGKKTKNVTVSIDYEDCLNAFEQVKSWESEYATFFQDHECIDVIYENLASDSGPEMRRIQEFLNLAHEDVQPSIFRQSKRSLSETISNYSELKEKFSGTPWTVFFDE
ncbi:MAG: Stf0 family sulfotransferase [Woeseiaceae bacterium]